ncbi:cytochrome P450 [Sulfobacillus thermosulfidooxidans]|uniref:cytochrome P450 n=1 Tax=Sulfobacillus thermosulfidooxidans TaxID=28034 RepID=UPI000B083599|nr:cytochrome P450 [Sulfobacillus thermosulfidooxidans]
MDGRFIKRTPAPRTPQPKYQSLPVLAPSMLVTNPPDHTRLRNLVNRACQPKHLERLRPYIAELARELLDSFVNNGSGNLVEDYAFPLPALVIAELIGVPAKDRSLFRSLSQKIALMIDPTQEPVIRPQGQDARWELLDYFHHLTQEKKLNPGDDLLTPLPHVMGESRGIYPEGLGGTCV